MQGYIGTSMQNFLVGGSTTSLSSNAAVVLSTLPSENCLDTAAASVNYAELSSAGLYTNDLPTQALTITSTTSSAPVWAEDVPVATLASDSFCSPMSKPIASITGGGALTGMCAGYDDLYRSIPFNPMVVTAVDGSVCTDTADLLVYSIDLTGTNPDEVKISIDS